MMTKTMMMNKVYLVIVMPLMLSVLMSCGVQGSVSGKTPYVYNQATEAFLKGQHPRAETLFKQFLSNNAGHLYRGDAHYYLGRIYMRKGEGYFSKARVEFQRAVENARREETQVLARFSLGKVCMTDPSPIGFNSRVRDGLSIFEDLEDDHRHLVSRDELLYRIGMGNFYLSDISGARSTFNHLISGYGSSRWARDAKRRGLNRYKQYSIQLGAYKNYASYQKFVNDLRSQGVQTFLVRWAGLYCARVGPFDNYEKARLKATELQKRKLSAIMKP